MAARVSVIGFVGAGLRLAALAALGAVLGAALPAHAKPLRLNLDSEGTHELAQAVAAAVLQATFETALELPPPREPGEFVEQQVLVAPDTGSLEVLIGVDVQEAAPAINDVWVSPAGTMAETPLPADEGLEPVPVQADVAPAAPRRLGLFAPPVPPAIVDEPADVDTVSLPPPAAAPATALNAAHAAATAEEAPPAPRTQRSPLVWLVVPLVLAAMAAVALWGRGGRPHHGGRRRRTAAR